MRLLASFIVALLVLVGVIVFWLWISFPTVSYRYRLSIAVDVNGQSQSGSSVIKVRYRFNPDWAAAISNGIRFNVAVNGQAPLIDLGTRGVLVAALHSGTASGHIGVSASELAIRAYRLATGPRQGSDIPETYEAIREISKAHGSVELTSQNLPLFVWFPNRDDPKTARVLQAKDFATVIGNQTQLSSAQIEMTNDPIVIDLDKRLPWYDALKTTNGAVKADGILLGYTAFIGSGTYQ